MSRLNHDDRTHLRRAILEGRARPTDDRPFSKPPDVERPDASDIAFALLAEELHATEVVMSVDELEATRRERFGRPEDLEAERAPALRLTACCERCGARITKNDAGFWIHTEPTNDCALPTLAFRESRL